VNALSLIGDLNLPDRRANAVHDAAAGFHIRALAIDLDGTVLGSDGRISDRNVAAVEAFRASGRQIVVATGRSRRSALPWIRRIGGVSGLVCHNGASVFDGDKANGLLGEPFEHRPIPEAAARRLVAFSRSLATHFHAFRGESWHYERFFPETAIYEKRTGFAGLLSNFDGFSELCLTRAMFLGVGVDSIQRAAHEACGDSVSVFLSEPGYLEIVARGISKAAGLRAWLARRNWVPSEVMAIGDAENDREMLLQAGLGVVMGNAPMALRERIVRVTGSITSDGAAAFLEAFLEQESRDK
jgi:Cof subfamily protein (haloacid dehalogenase superfamily)